MTTVWIYVDTKYLPGHPDYVKVFANPVAADEWCRRTIRKGWHSNMRSCSEGNALMSMITPGSKREQFAGPRIMETCPQPGHMLPNFRPRRPPTLGPFFHSSYSKAREAWWRQTSERQRRNDNNKSPF